MASLPGIPSGYAYQQRTPLSQESNAPRAEGMIGKIMVRLGLKIDGAKAAAKRNRLDRFAAQTPLDVQSQQGMRGLATGLKGIDRPADRHLLAELTSIEGHLK